MTKTILLLRLFTLAVAASLLPACTTVVEKPAPVTSTTTTVERTRTSVPGAAETTTTRTY